MTRAAELMLAAKGDRLTTGELAARFGVTAVQLKRWFDRGWIRGTWAGEAHGSGGRLLWEPWVARIIPLLLDDRTLATWALSGVTAIERRRRHEALARALSAAPDAPWFVWFTGVWLPAQTAAETVELLRWVRGPHRLVVSLPDLDD